MSTLASVMIRAGLTPAGGFEQPMPLIEAAEAVDEGQTASEVHVADGATAVALPGIGAGPIDITQIQYFYLLAYGTITLTWAGGTILLQGSVSAPAVFLVARTSTAVIPLVSNASGVTVRLSYQYGGS